MTTKKTKTKTQLAHLYGVNYNTFASWLKDIPNLNLNPRQRILTPMQVERIFNYLGEP